MNHAPKTANATFCATLCDQLWADGLTAAFVAPGSRSTPMALALIAHNEITVDIFHDERSAAFAALGHGLATGTPGLVLCSSGTAGAHFYAAAIEAEASAVPMIICTADRPPELWGRGAPQTIDQTRLYGDTVLDFVEPGPPDDSDPATWRLVARRLWKAATGPTPGPVHANLSFRDPLTGTPHELPPAIEPAADRRADSVDDDIVDQVIARIAGKSGVLIVGRNQTDSEAIVALADRLQWPILADHRSGCRDASFAVAHFDALLREPTFADAYFPQVVLRIGEIVASKSTSQWLSRCGADVLASRPYGRNIDPEDIASLQFDEAGFVASLHTRLSGDVACEPSWLDAWQKADGLAAAVIDDHVATATSEVSVACNLIKEIDTPSALVISSSMPVRDVEWFARANPDMFVLANRGANGIDGIVATAIGVALSGIRTVCLIGDVALLHDSSSLIALRNRDIDLSIVVIDNDGGGIFSFLPQHDLLDADTFETLFGTPHGTDIAALAAAHGLPVRTWDGPDSPLLTEASHPRMTIVKSERKSNLQTHDILNQTIAAALRA